MSSWNTASRFSGAPVPGNGALLRSEEVLVNEMNPLELTRNVEKSFP